MLNIVKIYCMPLVHDFFVPVEYLFEVDLNKLLNCVCVGESVFVCVCVCVCVCARETE